MGDSTSLRRWIDDLLIRRGVSRNALATGAGIQASTLYRFLNGDTDDLNRATIARIEQFVDEMAPNAGLRDGDARPYMVDPARFAAPDPARFPHIISFEVMTHALLRLDIAPGDILVIDTQREAADGDIVIAQNYDDTAETILRVYAPPHLVAASDDPALRRPLYVDGKTVALRGVVVRQLRSREIAKAG